MLNKSLGSWEYEFLFDPPDFVGIEAEFHSFNKNIDLTLMSAAMDFPFVSGKEIDKEDVCLFMF